MLTQIFQHYFTSQTGRKRLMDRDFIISDYLLYKPDLAGSSQINRRLLYIRHLKRRI